MILFDVVLICVFFIVFVKVLSFVNFDFVVILFICLLLFVGLVLGVRLKVLYLWGVCFFRIGMCFVRKWGFVVWFRINGVVLIEEWDY